MDGDFKGPKFGPEVDVGILEAASNSIYACEPHLFESLFEKAGWNHGMRRRR